MLTDTGAVADSHYGEIGFSQGAFSINTMTDLLATTSRMVINNQGNGSASGRRVLRHY